MRRGDISQVRRHVAAEGSLLPALERAAEREMLTFAAWVDVGQGLLDHDTGLVLLNQWRNPSVFCLLQLQQSWPAGIPLVLGGASLWPTLMAHPLAPQHYSIAGDSEWTGEPVGTGRQQDHAGLFACSSYSRLQQGEAWRLIGGWRWEAVACACNSWSRQANDQSPSISPGGRPCRQPGHRPERGNPASHRTWQGQRAALHRRLHPVRSGAM